MSSHLILDHYPLPTKSLPAGWAIASIGEIARFVSSGFPSGQHNQEQRGVPHIRPMNIDREGRLDLTVLKYVEGDVPRELSRGDVLFNNTNSPELIGKTTAVLIDGRLGYSNHMTRIRLEDGLDPVFAARQLHFLWMTGYFRHRCVNHVNQASISADPLSETVPFLVPAPAEQIRIAEALDELLSHLNAGVEALQRVSAKLAQYRASVLKAAVEGSLTFQWRHGHPYTEPGSALLERILIERRRRWEEEQLHKWQEKGTEPPKHWKTKFKDPRTPATSHLPPLPDGWCWATWAQVGLSQNGRPFPSREYQDSGFKLLRPGNLYARGAVGWTQRNTRYMPTHYADESAGLIIGGGELVINLTAQSLKDDFLGRVCITSEDESCLLNQRLARLTPLLVLPKFMLWVFKSAYFRRFVAGLNSGSLIQHMFTSQLEEFVFPLPPLDEQAACVEAIEAQLSVIEHLENNLDLKVQSTQTLRQAIFAAAFTGRLVPQDATDESGLALLEQIAAEREVRKREVGVRKRNMKPKEPRRRRVPVIEHVARNK